MELTLDIAYDMNKIDSKIMKENITTHYLFQRNMLLVADEIGMYAGIADVAAITPTRKLYEIEIKVTKADLMGEIKSIQTVLREDTLFEAPKGMKKYTKHWHYLKNAHSDVMIPNKFFFAVPPFLIKETLQYLKDTPYGLVDKDGFVKKLAKDLHDRKINDKTLIKFAQKVCVRGYQNRDWKHGT